MKERGSTYEGKHSHMHKSLNIHDFFRVVLIFANQPLQKVSLLQNQH